jgi:hypothetical protein
MLLTAMIAILIEFACAAQEAVCTARQEELEAFDAAACRMHALSHVLHRKLCSQAGVARGTCRLMPLKNRLCLAPSSYGT